MFFFMAITSISSGWWEISREQDDESTDEANADQADQQQLSNQYEVRSLHGASKALRPDSFPCCSFNLHQPL
jgi:hypothetical protein